MRFLSKLVIILTGIALVVLIYIFSLSQLLATPESVSAPLEKGGVYGVLADSIRTSMSDSLKAAQVSGANVDAILSQAVTATSTKAAVRPTLISITDWLETADTTDAPTLTIDLTNIKSRIVNQAKREGSADVAFVATREIPDTLDPLKDGNKQSDAATPASQDAKTNPLVGIKTNYRMIVGYMLPLAVGVAIGFVLLVIFALRKPKQRLKWPAYVLLMAGLLVLGLAYALPFILGSTVLSSSAAGSSNAIILATLKAALETTTRYCYLILVVGAGLFIVGQFVMRNPDKKRKR